MFERNVNDIPNIWQQVGKLNPQPNVGDGFGGSSITIDGNWLVVGASWDREKGSNSGSAFYFKRDQRYNN